MKEISKKEEKQFWTHGFKDRRVVDGFYKISESSYQFFKKFLVANCVNKNVLEYGCGTGSYAFFLVEHGAKVTGIDICQEAVELAQKEALAKAMSDIKFLVMDAERMQFENNSFDLICGNGILHHLNLQNSIPELARVLKSGGKAIFFEPMGHNPAINLFRKLTPKLRTKSEHPLTIKDLKFMQHFFDKVNCQFFHLFSLSLIPFRNTKIFSGLIKTLDKLDNKFLEYFPMLRKFAWQVIIILEKPKKI
jgi:ubiquinone/menaquinone biosynthesis C-methylase UbiE